MIFWGKSSNNMQCMCSICSTALEKKDWVVACSLMCCSYLQMHIANAQMRRQASRVDKGFRRHGPSSDNDDDYDGRLRACSRNDRTRGRFWAGLFDFHPNHSAPTSSSPGSGPAWEVVTSSRCLPTPTVRLMFCGRTFRLLPVSV